jgi:hypothetical protein
MSFGVIYLLTGAQHAARLVVSIHSLRRFYDGPSTLFTTRSESSQIAAHLAADDRLRVGLAEFEEGAADENSSYLAKPRLIPASPYEATLFLDADTLVVGDLTELVDATQEHTLVVTGFCDWKTTYTPIRRRLELWQPLVGTPGDVFGLDDLLAAMSMGLPVINTGVLGCHRDSPVLDPWQRLTALGKDTALPDEVALQLLLPRYRHRFLDSRFNCSPAFGPHVCDVRIWHFVARSHLGHHESQQLWKPAYDECWRANVANLRHWSRVADVTGDEELEKLARWPQEGSTS